MEDVEEWMERKQCLSGFWLKRPLWAPNKYVRTNAAKKKNKKQKRYRKDIRALIKTGVCGGLKRRRDDPTFEASIFFWLFAVKWTETKKSPVALTQPGKKKNSVKKRTEKSRLEREKNNASNYGQSRGKKNKAVRSKRFGGWERKKKGMSNKKFIRCADPPAINPLREPTRS